MDAKIVWHTWRKILRDETLQQQLFEYEWQSYSSDKFSNEEKAVISAYADNIDRAKWFIENYQFRLVNSFINALETGAPLTLRALLNINIDITLMSRTFLRYQQWRDYGPRVYSYCLDILSWLKTTSKEWGVAEPLIDLINLEYKIVELYLSLQYGKPKPINNKIFSYTGMATLYSSQYQLSYWLRNKKELGLTSPPLGQEHFLVMLPDLNSRHKYLLIPQPCAELYKNLPASNIQLNEIEVTHLNRLVAANAIILRDDANEMC